MLKTMQISDSVARALAATGFTADQMLREVLRVKSEGLETKEGVTFPEGSAFVAWYKDRGYWATVRNGQLEFNGQQFTSVSAAAGKITGRPTNGWDFWQCKLPGKSDFVRISTLRAN